MARYRSLVIKTSTNMLCPMVLPTLSWLGRGPKGGSGSESSLKFDLHFGQGFDYQRAISRHHSTHPVDKLLL
jgi:hypothetical protein